ncbi:MAG: 4Fe-4S dicluster domain-containing protein [Anaerolineales bacterium]|nr:4Fe-4S dicluster domain-containing protein [Anaerolineales bacterium]
MKEQAFNRHLARIKIERIDLVHVRMRSCQLCGNPACVEACPWHAIEYSDGLHMIVVDVRDCVGCGLCVDACPFQAISMWPDRDIPVVCDFCAGHPVCVEVCPAGALAFEATPLNG